MVRVYRGTNETCRVEFRDNKTTKRYTHPWKVALDPDDPPLSAPEILMLPGVPKPGRTTYRPRNGIIIPFAICRSVSPKKDGDGRKLWTVMCEFEKEGPEDETKDDNDPMSLAPKIEPFCDGMEFPIMKDFDDILIVDPFKRKFAEPVLASIPLAGVRVTRYVPSYDEQTLAFWKFCTNDSEWRGQPEDSWYIRDVTGKEVEFGDFTIGQLTFDIVSNPLELQIGTETRRIGWQATRLLESEKYKDPTTGDEQWFRNKGDGSPTVQNIDSEGHPTNEQTFVAFRKCRQRDFNQIVRT
jgi:hypothetical protein